MLIIHHSWECVGKRGPSFAPQLSLPWLTLAKIYKDMHLWALRQLEWWWWWRQWQQEKNTAAEFLNIMIYRTSLLYSLICACSCPSLSIGVNSIPKHKKHIPLRVRLHNTALPVWPAYIKKYKFKNRAMLQICTLWPKCRLLHKGR